jgi:hypothetical protein
MSIYPPPPDSATPAPAVMRADILAPGNPPTIHLQAVHSKRPPVWLQRLTLLVQVLFCVYLGILLVILPWWPRLLETNELINAFPTLHTWLLLGPVRGIISGLGLVDIWIGLSEVIHYHELR